MKQYRNTQTSEIVFEEDALDYALFKLGIKLEEDINNVEQEEFKSMITEWYYSGNWIEEDMLPAYRIWI